MEENMEKKQITVIETDIWEPSKENPKYLTKVRDKTVKEVYAEVIEFLKEQNLYDELDYFNVSYAVNDKEEFPAWKWIACYAVVGGSEGHYIHIDIIPIEGNTINMFTGKTFLGIDHALKISNLLTKVFWDEMR